MNQRTYRTEFGPEFHPHARERAKLAAEGLQDVSWHNDACPSWAVMDGDDMLATVFVDAVLPEHRETHGILESVRFSAQGLLPDGDFETLYDGDNLDDAIGAARKFAQPFLASRQQYQSRILLAGSLGAAEDALRILSDALSATRRDFDAFRNACEGAGIERPTLAQVALCCDDEDDAVRMIQDALGVEDGGLAGIMLSDLEWHAEDPDDRKAYEEGFGDWIAAEVTNLSEEQAVAAIRKNEGPICAPHEAREWLCRTLLGSPE